MKNIIKRMFIPILILAIFLCMMASCTSKDAEADFIPEPFELIIYEEDGYGYVYHKVLYNKETEMYYEYRYYYQETAYRNLDHIDYNVYDKSGKLISSEELSE